MQESTKNVLISPSDHPAFSCKWNRLYFTVRPFISVFQFKIETEIPVLFVERDAPDKMAQRKWVKAVGMAAAAVAVVVIGVVGNMHERVELLQTQKLFHNRQHQNLMHSLV